MHSHIAGSKVNGAPCRVPEERRFRLGLAPQRRISIGNTWQRPSTFATGYHMRGWDTRRPSMRPFRPLGARQAHAEFRDTPIIDKLMLVLMGNNHAIMEAVRAGDDDRLRQTVAWLLDATKGME